MHLMDEVAFTATRFSRMRMVTVSSDKINFTKRIDDYLRIDVSGRYLSRISDRVQEQVGPQYGMLPTGKIL